MGVAKEQAEDSLPDPAEESIGQAKGVLRASVGI
jgi:hypothetical protein